MKFTFKPILFFVFAFLLSAGAASAQGVAGYKTGIGLRAGNAAGLTVKHFIKNDAAIEGILSSSFRRHGFNLTVLYEKHARAFGHQNFTWFYGAGGHIGNYKGRYYYYGYRHKNHKHYDYYYDYYDDNFFVLGIDGIIGLEYYIREIPFTVGLDFKPAIEFAGSGTSHIYGDLALSLRYVF